MIKGLALRSCLAPSSRRLLRGPSRVWAGDAQLNATLFPSAHYRPVAASTSHNCRPWKPTFNTASIPSLPWDGKASEKGQHQCGPACFQEYPPLSGHICSPNCLDYSLDSPEEKGVNKGGQPTLSLGYITSDRPDYQN